MTTRSETAQTLDRGLRVLQLLGTPEHSAGMTVSEISATLGLARAIVYRLIATLEARDFLTRRSDGRVQLGLGVARLQLSVRPILAEVARPILRALADEVGATAHLTIAEGDQGLAVLVVEPSWTDLHVAYRVGSRHTLSQGAAGRAILELRRGASSPVDTKGELQRGAHGLAAPITGVPGLEASVGVVSMQPLPESVAGLVQQAAADVRGAMGGPASVSEAPQV